MPLKHQWGRGGTRTTSPDDPPHWEGVVQQQDLHLRDTSQTEHLIHQTQCRHSMPWEKCTNWSTQQETQCWTPLTCVQTADRQVVDGWTVTHSLHPVVECSEGLGTFVEVELKAPDTLALGQHVRHTDPLQ